MKTRSLVAFVVPFVLLMAACAAETGESDPADDDDTSEESADLTAKLTFANVGPIVADNCGGCHAPFKTLDGIKAQKTQMIAELKSGAMPKGNPGFKSTADGKKVLKWLKTGKDLK